MKYYYITSFRTDGKLSADITTIHAERRIDVLKHYLCRQWVILHIEEITKEEYDEYNEYSKCL